MTSTTLARTLLTAAVVTLGTSAHAQTPYLVADVRTGVTIRFTDPRFLTATGDAAYFLASLPSGERALMRIGADHVPVMVRTVASGSGSGYSKMAVLGSGIVFAVEGNLWRSDGTAAGTEVIAKFAPGDLMNSPLQPVAVGGTLYFDVQNSLWKTDGTATGTVLLSASGNSAISAMRAGATRLYFDRWSATATQQLWTSDGTVAGTVRVETPLQTLSPLDGAAVGDTLLYSRDLIGPSSHLLRTDGSLASTSLVRLFAGAPSSLTRFGSHVMFGASEPATTVGLWRTDGTAAGTVLVEPDVAPLGMYDWSATMIVHSRNAAGGSVLWRSDGTADGTSEIATLSATACSSFPLAHFAALPGAVVVARSACPEVWRTDGTEAGTFPILTSAPPHNGVVPIAHGGAVYLEVAASGAGPSELWRTDGTLAGTVRVSDAAFGPAPSFIGSLEDAAFFNGAGFFEGALRIGLWRTIGTPASTTPTISPSIPSRSAALFTLPDAFLFTGTPNLAVYRVGTDGKPSAIAPGPVPDLTFGRTATNGRLGLFPAGSAHARIPFRTDGTAAGTGAIPMPAGYSHFTDATPLARQSVERFQHGFALAPSVTTGLWFTDGTIATTPITPPGLRCESLKSAGDRVFALCGPAGGALSLYRSDGAVNGLTLVLTPDPGDTLRLPLLELDGWVYFVHERGGRSELWRSHTVGADPVSTGGGLPSDLEAYPLTASGGLVYFIGETAASGRELWRTDGSFEGTFRLRDIEPGIGSGLPAADVFAYDGQFAPVPGGLVFVATSTARGSELWRTDGTVARTLPLPEIVPGPQSSSIASLVRAGSRVFFSADDGVRGPRPWAIDLDPQVRAVSVGDATVRETDSDSVVASLPVSLDAPSTAPVVVTFETFGYTASAYADFLPAAGSLTFAPGEVSRTIDVPVLADAIGERPESFVVWINGVTGAGLADRHGVGVILDDDGPRISVGGASGIEGDSGPSPVVFQVTLITEDGTPSTAPVTVRAQAVPAVANQSDFWAVSPAEAPTVSFPAGAPSGSVLPLTVLVQGDTLEEPNEAFHLRFESGNEASVPAVGAVTGVIVDDDGIAAASPVEIAHGSRVLADLAPPVGRTSDVDFYVLRHDLHSSYEIVVDAVSGDAMPLQVERVVADGGVFQAALPTGTGNSVAMRFFGLGVSTDHIRVRSAACGTTCGPDDVYRLRMYETTLSSPRVNTIGGQATALIVQNTTDVPIAVVAAYWSAGGVMSSAHWFDVPAHGTAVVNVANVLPDFTGSVTVAHDGPYGGLVGKVVSTDPATGFSFESPLTSKLR